MARRYATLLLPFRSIKRPATAGETTSSHLDNTAMPKYSGATVPVGPAFAKPIRSRPVTPGLCRQADLSLESGAELYCGEMHDRDAERKEREDVGDPGVGLCAGSFITSGRAGRGLA